MVHEMQAGLLSEREGVCERKEERAMERGDGDVCVSECRQS
jgi:hypothetical protein